MDFPVEYWRELFWTLSMLVGGWLVGWVVEYIFLQKLPQTTLLRKNLSGMGRWMGLAAGLGLALRYSMLPPDWHDDVVLMWKISSILIVTVFLARLVGNYYRDQTAEISGDHPTTSLVQHVLRGAVYVVGVLVVLQMLGVSVTPMLTALGVGGLAVALALQDTLGNLFAGIQIIASRKIRLGDFIRLESGEEGYVSDITWRNTTIQTIPNLMVIIPNAKLASSIVTNTNLPAEEITARLDLGVHYDSDLEHVERVAIETAQAVLQDYPDKSDNPDVRVRFRAFGDSSINFVIFFQVRAFADQAPIQHLLIKALHKSFREAGINIPFPIRTLDFGGLDMQTLLRGKQD
ncbi:MAG: mechanosensitive ion channel family protein [Lewinellaceae bacterium]|nr:mechanosensitive ion channel family protein [Lewinellaceae bacterium]